MIRIKIQVTAETRSTAIETAIRLADGMRTGLNSINSHGPNVNLFAECVDEEANSPFGAHIHHPVTAEEAGLEPCEQGEK